MIAHVEVQRGRYHDSVRLMQASRALQAVPDVSAALVAMATELNLELLQSMGFDVSEAAGAGPNDLLLAVRADTEQAMAEARHVLEYALTARAADGGGLEAPEPRTLGAAARSTGARIALISVPGQHVFVEAMDALEHGLHVMIFSDNVPLEHEVRLKEYGLAHDLLVMGPDCGTAIVGGIGLGFTNAIAPGPVGIVGAAGTGIQELCCLLEDAGVGVRHAIGTGSRDLTDVVGGRSTLQGLEALDADPTTEYIVVVSKPPAPRLADTIRRRAADCAKPVVLTFMGETTLEHGAGEVLDLMGLPRRGYASWEAPEGGHRPGSVRGVFSGGTLAAEARFVAGPELGPIGTSETDTGHTFVDYGDDEFTRGRAHPMIDQTVRLDRLEAAADDESVGVILLDVVLGYGAHPDPASELAPAVSRAVEQGRAVVVSLCGTRGDPQGRDGQASILNRAGASVWLSNASAARHAARLGRDSLAGRTPT